MSKPNTSETKRLFLNTANATSKEKLLSAFEGIEDNNADATFHIGSADIVKNPASNIALSLIKCEYPNTLNLYNVHLGDDSPSIVVFSNESNNYANVQFTENTLDLTSATVYAPFRLCSNQQDLITLINTALKNANGGMNPTSLIVLDPYTNVLKSTGEFDIIFFNNIFNDPTFFAYDPDSKNIYRDLGLNTDTTLAFTYLEPLVAPTVPKHYFLNVTFDDLDPDLYVDHPGASGAYRLLPRGIAFDSAYATIIEDSTSAAFRRDANGYTYLWIRYPGAQGRYVFWMLKSNGPAGVFFQAPDFDWVGVTRAQLQAVPGSAETFFGDLGLHPGVPPNIGGGTLEWTSGGDIGTATIKDPTGTYPGAGADAINRTLAYPVGLNPSPLFLKTNLNFDSFATMNKGMKNIIAMIPIEATVLSSKNVTTLLPAGTDSPVVLSAPPPETEQKVNLDGSDDHINIPMDSNNPVLNWDQSWSLGFTAEQIHDASSGTGVKRTIATRGTNGIYLIIGTGNVGFYASATDGVYDPANNQGMTHAHGANTWYPTPASVKWLFTYNHTTGKLRWHVGEVVNGATPSHVQRGVVTMTSTERTINQSAEDLNIGDAMEGYYGSTYFDGHLDDLLITNNEMTGQQIVDYYTDDDFQSHEYSEHIVSSYNFNQEFPNVDDQVGSYNGTHQGSTNPDNFIPN